MGRFARLLMALGAAAALSACAEGVAMSESEVAREPIAPGQSRIVVFREGVMGFGVTPVVVVDGVPTGSCQSRGVFHVDLPPGPHALVATTSGTSIVRLSTQAGETAYVSCEIVPGLMMGQPQLKQVAAADAQAKVRELAFTGPFQVAIR